MSKIILAGGERGGYVNPMALLLAFQLCLLLIKIFGPYLYIQAMISQELAGGYDGLLEWYFAQTNETIWLSTAPGTRAEHFYRKAGWVESGTPGKEEIKFEMTAAQWKGCFKL